MGRPRLNGSGRGNRFSAYCFAGAGGGGWDGQPDAGCMGGGQVDGWVGGTVAAD
jgi:hypothetical protein